MSPKQKRIFFSKSELQDVLRKTPGVGDVKELETSRGTTYTGSPYTVSFTPLQMRSYSHLGIIHRQMANTETYWRYLKPDPDPDDVALDFFKVLPDSEKIKLKKQRELFTHSVGYIDAQGRFIGSYRFGVPIRSLSSPSSSYGKLQSRGWIWNAA